MSVPGTPLAMTVRRAQAQSGLVPVDARVLLQHVLGADRAWMVAHADDALTASQASEFFALAKRRRDGEPVAYLTGRREFRTLDLAVTPAVLIPRPETETLVELALAVLPFEREMRVLDIGTGSGAIALALASDRPRARVLATDISEPALTVAQINATKLGIRNVAFLRADLYTGLPAESDGGRARPGAPYDLIVSNPPYIGASDPHLGEGDLRFEPVAALVAGADGLDVLRPLISHAPQHLLPGGHLVVEHGYDQADSVRALFGAAGFDEIVSVRDLSGIPRAMRGRRPPDGGSAGAT